MILSATSTSMDGGLMDFEISRAQYTVRRPIGCSRSWNVAFWVTPQRRQQHGRNTSSLRVLSGWLERSWSVVEFVHRIWRCKACNGRIRSTLCNGERQWGITPNPENWPVHPHTMIWGLTLFPIPYFGEAAESRGRCIPCREACTSWSQCSSSFPSF